MHGNGPIVEGVPTDRLRELSEEAEQAFTARFGRSPTMTVAAPGRVNLIGEHIDYNDGFVLPMAVERYVVITAAAGMGQGGDVAQLHSLEFDEGAEIPLVMTTAPRTNGWGRYVEGVIVGFLGQGVTVPGFDAIVHSNVPLGGGLSSSAALEVATATLLERLTGTSLDPTEKALLCQQAEHKFAGVPCGIMDQFSSVFGRLDELMLLDCRSQQLEAVPFLSPDVTILITNSNVRHELTGGEYAERRRQCDDALRKLGQSTWRDVTRSLLEAAGDRLNATEYRRARHVVGEIERTTAAATALRSCEWTRVGELMYASHASLRDDFEVSCAELDLLVDLAQELGESNGVLGSRMTGGGFGGCTVTLVDTDRASDVAGRLTERYQSRTGIEPHSFVSRPAQGAHVLRG